MVKIIAALTLGLSVLFAQPMGNPDYTAMPYDNPMMSNPDRPEILSDNPMMYDDFMCKQDPKQMVETIRIYKITEALNLTEDQSTRFFPKLKEMRDAKEDFNQTRMRMVEKMDGYLKDPKKFQNEIKSLMQEFEASETKLREKEARIKREIANILTPEQQAKFMLFQMRFNKEMREMVGKARDMRKGMREMRKERREERRETRRWRFW